MKNVIVYNKVTTDKFGGKRNDHLIDSYLRAQIENSLYYGWAINDIIIATNFEFEHRGVKNIELTDICYDNGFNNKWYGIRELFHKHFKEPCWMHDYDNWQIGTIEFPQFSEHIAGCTYVYSSSWNTASMFFKPECVNVLNYIYDFLKLNAHIKFNSDEDAICAIRTVPEIVSYFANINQQYNVGMTKLNMRYDAAHKPVKVVGCKLLHPEEYNNIMTNYGHLNLVPEHLQAIVKRYTHQQ